MYGQVLLVVSAAWVLSEIGLLLFRRAAVDSDRQDEGTLRLLNAVIYVCVGLAMYIAARGIGHIALPAVVRWTGIGVILLGLAIRWWAVLTLREFFTVDVAIRRDHHLVRSGPYRLIRHPAYSGSLLSFAGLALCVSSWISAAVLLIPIAGVFLYRVRVEENALRNAFPGEYPEYSRGTFRIVPGLY